MSEQRLQKILARAGCGSRRACETFLEEGRVKVNGQRAKLGDKADPETDEILFDGVPVRPSERFTLALNKPCGYASSLADSHAEHCVSELIPHDAHPSLFHVGRLDVDTSGLLLFTTDGDLGNRLTHPSQGVVKTYIAQVQGELEEEALEKLRQGVLLEDGLTAPAEADLVRSSDLSVVRLRIHEGRNRQVRRMLEAVGHPVITLERVAIGAYELAGLSLGSWRELTEGDLELLFVHP